MDNLDKYLYGYQSKEFDWSKMNCGHFLARWVLENEGFDPLAGVSFPNTPEGVAEVVAKYGSMHEMIGRLLNRGSIGPSFAMRGDAVMAPLIGSVGVGAMAGICNGSTAVFLREGSGIVTLRMRVVSHVWRIAQ